MRRILLLASALALSACATVDPGMMAARTPVAPSAGLAVTDVTTGFMIGVMDACAAAAEAGKTLEQLNSPLIVRDDARPAMVKPRDGFIGWAPRVGQGVVMIDASATECEVSTYGVPVGNTFAAIANKLGERGYASEVVPSSPKYYATKLSKKVGDKTVTISLRGNEPGAAGMMSRFSTALGTVRVTTP